MRVRSYHLRVQARYSMLIEPAIYLQMLIGEFELAGGHLVVRDFQSVSQLLALPDWTRFAFSHGLRPCFSSGPFCRNCPAWTGTVF